MKDVKIFNFSKATDTAFVRTVIFRAREVRVPYYISRSWESGPHLAVTFDGSADDFTIEQFAARIRQEAEALPLDPDDELQVREQYRKMVNRIAVLEGKDVPEMMADHGTVEVETNGFHYHNPALTRIIHQMRFELQPVLEEVYFRLHEDGEPMPVLMPLLFHHVSETYRDEGRNKGYFSFISHVQGFLELSEKQNLPYTEADFEKRFRTHEHDIDALDAQGDPHIEHWKEVWGKISDSYKTEIHRNVDEGYLDTIRKSVDDLDAGFRNDFHQQFVHYFRRTGFLADRDATAYRFIINVLYLSLPFLKVSALKKQQFIYMSYRYTETKNARTWREEIGI
ncbi:MULTISPECIES: hypothetical protein [Bhargavaea]|uniref:Lantibiotic biosynthesis dehydratase C-term n=1 Tax=Bhargavaea changchunensis TaxID=2134037 RepID=A0ABW2NGH1_9BACL|nr:hypothetical protein [Bhargavaea sp. CC-171006]